MPRLPWLCLNYLVLAQNFIPLTLRPENHLDGFAHRSVSATGAERIDGCALYLLARVRRGNAESNAPHDHDVGQVVSDVRNVAGINPAVFKDLLKDRDLLDVPLIDVSHPALTRPLF